MLVSASVVQNKRGKGGLRISIITLLFLAPALSYGAELVKFGAKLCGPGQQLSNGNCVEKEQGVCPAGYFQTVIESTTFAGLQLRVQCGNVYSKYEMPSELYPIYNGVLVKFGPTLCAGDEQVSNGACVPKRKGICPDGYYRTVIGQNTFSAQSISDQQCMNAYTEYQAPDYIELIYNGILVNFGPTLCGAGKFLSNGACVPRERGDCPTNFYDVTGDMYNSSKTEEGETIITKINVLLPTNQDGTCKSGYSNYGLSQNCVEGINAPLCAVLCDSGLWYTGVGTCAEPCDGGVTHLRTSTGLSVPVYATQQITPSLRVLTSGGDMCYINALPGESDGTLNIQRADQIYHVTD